MMETDYDITYDKVLENNIGNLGKWHLMLFFQLFFIVLCPFVMYPAFSLTITVPHRCRIPLLDNNSTSLTFDEITNLTVPLKVLGTPPVPSLSWQPCLRYNTSWLSLLERPIFNYTFSELYSLSPAGVAGNINDSAAVSPTTEKCSDGYAYSHHDRWQNGTAAEHFNLVCDRAYLIPVSTMAYMIGHMCASTISGYLSDKFGRRIVIQAGLVGTYVTGILTAFSPNIWVFIVLRVLLGYSIMSMWMSYWVTLTEVSTSSTRNIFMAILNVGFGVVAATVFTLIAYIANNWRYIHISLTIFCLPSIIGIFYFPESPRWLLAHGDHNKAMKTLKRAIDINSPKSTPLKEEEIFFLLKNHEYEAAENRVNLWDVIKDEFLGIFILISRPVLLKRSCILFIQWFCYSFIYYTVVFYSVKIHVNPYFSFWLISISSIPASLIQYFLYKKFSRKLPLLICLIISVPICLGVVIYQQMQTHEHSGLPVVIATSFLKLLIDTAFSMMYIYTPELYPTEVRNYGIGTCSTIARVGSALAPFSIQLGETHWKPMPFLFFTILNLLCSILVFFLPETKDMPLYDTVEEMENPEKRISRGSSHSKASSSQACSSHHSSCDMPMMSINNDSREITDDC